MRFAIVTHRAGGTNTSLAARRLEGFDQVCLLSPREALAVLRPGDLALGRLDVRETLDGIEEGLWSLSCLAAHRVTVLNPPGALMSAHVKLLTARALERASLPHPRTEVIGPGSLRPALDPPIVLKPRFGSWGHDVVLCRDRDELARHLAELETRHWFRTHGALAQELVPPLGHDLRIVVAAGKWWVRSSASRLPVSGGRTSHSGGEGCQSFLRRRPATWLWRRSRRSARISSESTSSR